MWDRRSEAGIWVHLGDRGSQVVLGQGAVHWLPTSSVGEAAMCVM
jgi:hypothetical protein